MTQTLHPTSEDFSEYVNLLIQLHELIAQGRGDSEEADQIRDQMDWPWTQLNRRELALVNGLSADLSNLGQPLGEQTVGDVEGTAIRQAVTQGDMHQALELVRANESKLPSWFVALLRGVTWARLRQPEVALKFLDESARIESRPLDQDSWRMRCLIQTGRALEVVPKAREILQQLGKLTLRSAAFEVLLAAAWTLPDGDRARILREIIQSGESLVRDSQWLATPEQVASRSAIWLNVAIAYLELGQPEPATAACRQSLQLQPDNRVGLELLGVLHFGAMPDADRGSLLHRMQRESTQALYESTVTAT